MAKQKVNAGSDDWRHLARVGALVGGVLVTLALGAMLRDDFPSSGADERPLATSDAFTPPRSTSEGTDSRASAGDPGDETPSPGQLPPPEPTPRAEVVDPPAGRSSSGGSPEPRRQAPPAVSGASDPLSFRISETEDWLDRGSGWTLQFMLTCDNAKAARLLNDVDGDSRLHLVPTLHNDQVCLRICWNRYASREAAVTDRDIPSALLTLSQKPLPRTLADLAP